MISYQVVARTIGKNRLEMDSSCSCYRIVKEGCCFGVKYARVVFVFLLGFGIIRLFGQEPQLTIILTSKEVDTNSVRLITGPNVFSQNVVFNYIHKTSEEIKSIGEKRPWVEVLKGKNIVGETKMVSLWKNNSGNQTNYTGLVLIFTNRDQAELVEKTLRGY